MFVLSLLMLMEFAFLKVNGQANTTAAATTSTTSTSQVLCTGETTCNGKGSCSFENTADGGFVFVGCDCDESWATYPDPPSSDDQGYCNYERKSGLTAYLYAVFLGTFGAHRFYVGDITLGAIMCAITVVGCCCLPLCAAIIGEPRYAVVPAGCIACVMFVWWVVDLFIFWYGDPTDENGVALTPI